MWHVVFAVAMLALWAIAAGALVRIVAVADKAGANLRHQEWVAYLRHLLLPSRMDRGVLKRLGSGLRHHRSLAIPITIFRGALIAWLVLGMGAAAADIAWCKV